MSICNLEYKAEERRLILRGRKWFYTNFNFMSRARSRGLSATWLHLSRAVTLTTQFPTIV
jgi:hypothetical protein